MGIGYNRNVHGRIWSMKAKVGPILRRLNQHVRILGEETVWNKEKTGFQSRFFSKDAIHVAWIISVCGLLKIVMRI